jgi:DNA helicase II / ATP-dependent DNA helicase PcrA
VIICGAEEGIFPSYYAQEKAQTLEEERRLCYVAMTRAMHRLIFTYATRRRLYGREDRKKPSRFLKEIPLHLVELQEKQVQISSAYRSRFSIVAKNHPSASEQNNPTPELEGGFRLGQRVKHPIFGAGTLLDTEGQGERTKFRINFDHAGTKWLVLLYAELVPAS